VAKKVQVFNTETCGRLSSYSAFLFLALQLAAQLAACGFVPLFDDEGLMLG
jgi:hypothetical protein